MDSLMIFIVMGLTFSSHKCQNKNIQSYEANPKLMISTEPFACFDSNLVIMKSSTECNSDLSDSFDDEDVELIRREPESEKDYIKKLIFCDLVHLQFVSIASEVFKHVFRINIKPFRFRKTCSTKYFFFTSFKYLLTQLFFLVNYENEKFRALVGTDQKKEELIHLLFRKCVLENNLDSYFHETCFIGIDLYNTTEHRMIKVLNEIFFPRKFIDKNCKLIKDVAKCLNRKIAKANKFKRFDQINVELLDGSREKCNAKYYILYNFLREYME